MTESSSFSRGKEELEQEKIEAIPSFALRFVCAAHRPREGKALAAWGKTVRPRYNTLLTKAKKQSRPPILYITSNANLV